MKTQGFEDCQVVFSHKGEWDAFMRWLRQRGLKTFRIPETPGVEDLPTYGITFDD